MTTTATETTAAALPPVRVEADVGLADCLVEIKNALNYWYPIKGDASEDECIARHVRLFQFMDRLAKQLKANASRSIPGGEPGYAPGDCSAFEVIPENGDKHLCGLPGGHGGLHACRLCGFNWLTPDPQTMDDGKE